jgi:hypothetical protein
MNQIFDEARPVRQRIGQMLKDGNVSYTAALVAMANVMMDIVVLGWGKTEPEARSFLISLFIPRRQRQAIKRPDAKGAARDRSRRRGPSRRPRP